MEFPPSELEDDVLPALTEPKRRGGRTRTIPEQIADHLGGAIVNGEYRAGERVREQELASLYGVSRGPVREAIRALERRGLVEFFPRRGAYVVDLSLDAIADVFNIRAALMGLAARCFARRPSEVGIAALSARIRELEQLATDDAVDEVRFARFVGRTGAVVADNCGSGQLMRTLSEQVAHSLWGLLWRERPLDYFSLERRLEAVAEWRLVLGAIAAGDDGSAERLQRAIYFASRDHALMTLQQARGEAIDPVKHLRDG